MPEQLEIFVPASRPPLPPPPSITPPGLAQLAANALPASAVDVVEVSSMPMHRMRKRGVFFDFDSTITAPVRLSRFPKLPLADRPEIFGAMTNEEIVTNFGGRRRLERLAAMFSFFRESGCELFIVSIGFRDLCIIPHLRAVGLGPFFPLQNIFGQDSEELASRKLVKAQLIAEIMAQRGWAGTDALFVDDSAKHVGGATGLLDVVQVSGRGLSVNEMDAVMAIAENGAPIVAAWSADDTGRPWHLRRLDPYAADVGAWWVDASHELSPRRRGGLRAMSAEAGMASPARGSRLRPPSTPQQLASRSPCSSRGSKSPMAPSRRPQQPSPEVRRSQPSPEVRRSQPSPEVRRSQPSPDVRRSQSPSPSSPGLSPRSLRLGNFTEPRTDRIVRSVPAERVPVERVPRKGSI